MILITFIFIIVNIAGFNVLNYIALLFVIDIIILEINRHSEKHIATTNLKNELLVKIHIIEKICSDIAMHLEHSPSHMHIESMIEQRAVKQKEEFKDSMDRLAKKAVDIENEMNRLKRTIGSALYGIDERIKAVEELSKSE